MPNRSADALFQLIQSLQKSEKRAFKLYITRNSANADLKIIQLFDALDKQKDYDELQLLKKLPSIKKQQLSNLKAHLYREILASLRLLKSEGSIDIQLHEQLDYARILYNKGLYYQSLKILEKLKEQARLYNQDSFLIQIISLEKKIETLHITRSMQNRAESLATEATEINEKRKIITALSNLALQLYSWYIKWGHARNEKDEDEIRAFFKQSLPHDAHHYKGFYEQLYLFQSYCWYAFIRQDFLMYYRYTKKWVDLFDEQPFMMEIETGHYIKGIHNLLNAHFDLRNDQQFEKTIKKFEAFASSEVANQNHNNRIQTFIYLNIARLNQHFMQGSFDEGVKAIPAIEEKLEAFAPFMDRHRILVFYYKFASLYFGAGDYSRSIDYVHKIINWKVDLRNDLQCYARLLHLLAHYELSNYDLLDSLTRSVFRFMAKMENLTVIEERVCQFLRSTFHLSARALKPELQKLLDSIKGLEKNRYETRAFAYLDIISWLESKVFDKPMQYVVSEKYAKRKLRSA